MSFNRENVVWKSKDGTWSIGFYDVLWTGEDPEWDVEYDYGAFQWASTGHPSPIAAEGSWQGSNPGGHVVVDDPSTDDAERWDAMARDFLDAGGNAWGHCLR